MIKRLKQEDVSISKKIRDVFQISYAIEAKLLNAKEFPPLKRTINGFLKSNNTFYGYWKLNELAGVVEIKKETNSVLIQSLVVNPIFFRQGIASQLINFVFDKFNSKIIHVETGIDNIPAIKLYKSFGFKETIQYDTDIGIRKIRFKKISPS